MRYAIRIFNNLILSGSKSNYCIVTRYVLQLKKKSILYLRLDSSVFWLNQMIDFYEEISKQVCILMHMWYIWLLELF